MENAEEHIIYKATSFFSMYGTQSVPMDYIASHCGISKKTLYQFFESKEILVTAVVKNLLHPGNQHLDIKPGVALDAVTKIGLFFDEVEKLFQVLTPVFFRNIKKQFPKALHLIEFYGKDKLMPALLTIIKQGISEGDFKASVDEATVTDLYCRFLHNILEDTPGFLNKKNSSINITHHFFLNSLITVNGLKALSLKTNNLEK